jgi:hypothetical protein
MESLGLMKRFEKDRIDSIIPIIENIRRQVAERSTWRMPVYVEMYDNRTDHSALKYRIEADGVSVTFWDTYAQIEECMHVERGLSAKEFVNTYVTRLEDAAKIARNLNVSLG